ncbi:hypothetical protein BGZ98_001956 [Dissophora globulifera]|nr:hypothetical protein BGZ98_001956 [Dissophora globulifera]
MSHGLTIIPTLSVEIDIMGVGVVLVSIMGLFGVAKGCRRIMNLYFGLVICFIAAQVTIAVAGYMSGSSWIQEALERSWDRAYQTDKSLVQELQIEFHCQGFHSQDDRSVPSTLSPTVHLPPCGEILQLRFGKRLQRLGSLILCIRMIQLTGVFLLSILFRHLAAMDRSEESEMEHTDEESPFFKSEKQIEEESARVPLLSEGDDDLPHYSVNDMYGCEDYDDESDDESDDDESDDGEKQQRRTGRFCDDFLCGEDFEYRDKHETEVYVA